MVIQAVIRMIDKGRSALILTRPGACDGLLGLRPAGARILRVHTRRNGDWTVGTGLSQGWAHKGGDGETQKRDARGGKYFHDNVS